MLTSKDLMIGDWYAFRGHPYKCTASDIAALVECEEKGIPTDISEIPLTAEILDRNGFESAPAPSERVWMRNGQEVWLDNEEKKYWANIKNGEFYFEGYIEYIHELQHALRLCGIEKDIEL